MLIQLPRFLNVLFFWGPLTIHLFCILIIKEEETPMSVRKMVYSSERTHIFWVQQVKDKGRQE